MIKYPIYESEYSDEDAAYDWWLETEAMLDHLNPQSAEEAEKIYDAARLGSILTI